MLGSDIVANLGLQAKAVFRVPRPGSKAVLRLPLRLLLLARVPEGRLGGAQAHVQAYQRQEGPGGRQLLGNRVVTDTLTPQTPPINGLQAGPHRRTATQMRASALNLVEAGPAAALPVDAGDAATPAKQPARADVRQSPAPTSAGNRFTLLWPRWCLFPG